MEANVPDFCFFWLMLKGKCQIISHIQLDFEFQALYLFITTREEQMWQIPRISASQTESCDGNEKKLYF